MRWSVAALVGLGVGASALFLMQSSGPALAVVGFGLVSAASVWWLGPCRHPGPLGLLPPVTNPDGTKTAAQWFCDQCGKSWTAEFRREHQPIRRFEGHDETKAAAAARRADDLAKRTRTLALRRAGFEPASRPRLHASPESSHVVPMARVRRFANK